MDQDVDFSKLSLEDRCEHKSWKARISGYADAEKLFTQLEDPKAADFQKFLPYMKKFANEPNAIAQDKALSAVLAYVENSAFAGKCVSDVVSGMIQKAFTGKPKVKETAVEICLMFVEIEKHAALIEELSKGLSHKTPKVVIGCIHVFNQALIAFGWTNFSLKSIFKELPNILDNKDPGIRCEAKNLTHTIFTWIGSAIHSSLKNVKPFLLSELEAEFNNISAQNIKPPTPSRFLRSKKNKMASPCGLEPSDNVDAQSLDCTEPQYHCQQPDKLDLLEEVDVLSLLPKDFFSRVEEVKWSDRKEALESLLLLLTENPKLCSSSHYGDLVKVLKKVISIDKNVAVVGVAINALALLPQGLRKKFAQFSTSCTSLLLDKFKEKKPNIVISLRNAVDHVAVTLPSYECIHDDVLEATENKNPSVRAESVGFIARLFSNSVFGSSSVPKKLRKGLLTTLLRSINDTDPSVREASVSALGTLLKIFGEKEVLPMIGEIDKIKLDKVKEYSNTVQIKRHNNISSSIPIQSKEAMSSNPSKQRPSAKSSLEKVVSKKIKSNKVPIQKTKATQKKNDDSTNSTSISQPNKRSLSLLFVEQEITYQDAVSLITDQFSSEVSLNKISELQSSNWKERLNSAEHILKFIEKSETRQEFPVQAFVHLICKKPGLKDNNIHVFKVKCAIISCLASYRCALSNSSRFSRVCVSLSLPDLVDKIGDAKASSLIFNTLYNISEAIGFPEVLSDILKYVLVKKNPKNQEYALNWCQNGITDFGLEGVDLKSLISNLQTSLQSPNPNIRNSSISVLGVLSIYTRSEKIVKKIASELKTSLAQSLEAELAKYKGRNAKPPCRGPLAETKTPSEEVECDSSSSKEDEIELSAASETSDSATLSKKLPPNQNGGILDSDDKSTRIEEYLSSNPCAKWNFSSPSPEYMFFLKRQTLRSGISTELCTAMFDISDLEVPLSVLDYFSSSLISDVDATISHLDIILRWITIKFYENNLPFDEKCLQYLADLFLTLTTRKYVLSEYEASTFFPHVFSKLSDPHESLREQLRKDLLHKAYALYPISKVMQFLLEALKRCNLNQKACCFQELHYALTYYSLSTLFECRSSLVNLLKIIISNLTEKNDHLVEAAVLDLLWEVFSQFKKESFGEILSSDSFSEKEVNFIEERLSILARDKVAVHCNNLSNDSSYQTNLVSNPQGLHLKSSIRTFSFHKKNGNTDSKYEMIKENIHTANSLKFDTNNNDNSLEMISSSSAKHNHRTLEVEERNKYVIPPLQTSNHCDKNFNSEISSKDADNFLKQTLILEVLNKMSSESFGIKDSFKSLLQCEEALKTPHKEEILETYAEKLVYSVSILLQKFFRAHSEQMCPEFAGSGELLDLSKDIFSGMKLCLSLLITIFSDSDANFYLTNETLCKVLYCFFRLLSQPVMSNCRNFKLIQRSIHLCCNKIVTNFEITQLLVVILLSVEAIIDAVLLDDSNAESLAKFTFRCLSEIRQNVNKKESLNLFTIISHLSIFTSKYSINFCKKRKNDIIYRIIKTMIFYLTLAYKEALYLIYLENFKNTQENELEAFMLKFLQDQDVVLSPGAQLKDLSFLSPANKGSMDTNSCLPFHSQVHKKNSNDTLVQIHSIFVDISNSVEYKTGIHRLYHFLIENPEFDFASFIAGRSLRFRKFIYAGLLRVKKEKKLEKGLSDRDEMRIKNVISECFLEIKSL